MFFLQSFIYCVEDLCAIGKFKGLLNCKPFSEKNREGKEKDFTDLTP